MNIDEGIEIYHAGDLPAQAGMGTSSAFTVGLLNALHALRGNKVDKMQLALEAIHVEQDLIRESVGSQDQTTCAFGGFNRIDFTGSEIRVTPIKSKRIMELQDYLMLLFTGFSRVASSIEKEKIERIPQNTTKLRAMYEMVAEGQKILSGNSDIKEFGQLLAEAWRLKRSLSSQTSTEYIDYLYDKAIRTGAIGGKVLGAGGGGFLLLFVEPDAQTKVKQSLKLLLEVPFRFDNQGSQVIFDDSR